jgi:hypothetical protein
VNDEQPDDATTRIEAKSGDEATQPAPKTPLASDAAPAEGDGCIPDELRDWFNEAFPEEEVLRSLNELNEQECRELGDFIDLNELEEAVSREQAQRQRQRRALQGDVLGGGSECPQGSP